MIEFRLKSFLEAHQIPVYRLAAQMGRSAPNIHRLLQGSGPKNFNAETLSDTLEALQVLTGQAVTVGDLLVYKRSNLSDVAGVTPAAGKFIPREIVGTPTSTEHVVQLIASERR
jgi:hypothetical protein